MKRQSFLIFIFLFIMTSGYAEKIIQPEHRRIKSEAIILGSAEKTEWFKSNLNKKATIINIMAERFKIIKPFCKKIYIDAFCAEENWIMFWGACLEEMDI